MCTAAADIGAWDLAHCEESGAQAKTDPRTTPDISPVSLCFPLGKCVLQHAEPCREGLRAPFQVT